MEERAKVKKWKKYTNSLKQPRGKNVCVSVYLNHELFTHEDTTNALLLLFYVTLP